MSPVCTAGEGRPWPGCKSKDKRFWILDPPPVILDNMNWIPDYERRGLIQGFFFFFRL